MATEVGMAYRFKAGTLKLSISRIGAKVLATPNSQFIVYFWIGASA